MKERIITGVVLIAILLVDIFFVPVLFMPLVAVLLLISIWEWCRICWLPPQKRLITWAGVLLLWVLSMIYSNVLTALLGLVVLHYLYAIYFIVQYERVENYRINTNYLFYCGLFILPTLAASLFYIFHQSNAVEATGDAMTLIFIIMTVACADSGAYFVGKLCGKHKLSPRVSPNKTVEGLLGGLLTVTVFVGIFHSMVAGWYLSFAQLWVISMITALFSVVGDLFISIIKRQNGIKDTSQLLPGHGGVLDRIDGLLAGVPVFYFLQQFV